MTRLGMFCDQDVGAVGLYNLQIEQVDQGVLDRQCPVSAISMASRQRLDGFSSGNQTT